MSNIKKWIISIISLLIVFLAVGVIIQYAQEKGESPAEKQKIAAMVKQLTSLERGDLLIMASNYGPRIAYVTTVEKNTLHCVFRIGEGSAEISLWLTPSRVTSRVERIVRKNDAEYTATAVKFLQQ